MTESTGLPAELEEAKLAQRRRLGGLPIEEKLRIIVRMQELAAEIAAAAGRPVRPPWKL